MYSDEIVVFLFYAWFLQTLVYSVHANGKRIAYGTTAKAVLSGNVGINVVDGNVNGIAKCQNIYSNSGFLGIPHLFRNKNTRNRHSRLNADDEDAQNTFTKLKKVPFPVNNNAPLSNIPLPPWAFELVARNDPSEPYVPRHYSEEEIAEYMNKEETRRKVIYKDMQTIPCEKLKSYGFKFKQIQPVRHFNGNAFTYFYVHSLHTDVIPVLLNSLRRVAKRHLGAGRITALRIPGFENEFYSVVGLREDYFDLVRNLRGIVFRNVPESATFNKPIIGRLRLKGPIIAVAGHIDLEFDEDSVKVGSSSGSFNDRKVEIVNKNHYVCTLSNDAYLSMDVKIEYIANYVIPEHGPESLNRDITDDGFIHFCSSCLPVQKFAFQGDRRGLDESSTSEIVTLEVHTDGSTTPKLALLKSATFLLNWFQRSLEALQTDPSPDYVSMESAKREINLAELVHPELHRNVPWNPYKNARERIADRLKWFYRKDVIRQYPIDPESRMAKEEQLAEWHRGLENQLLYEQQIPPVLSDDEENESIMDRRERETEEAYNNPPSWVFKDPAGPGNLGQGAIFDFDPNDITMPRPDDI
ncbi:bifunctional RNA polymerase [Babesia duncani]|uniref:Bifunctional RNA polymerase n=1 Tax=Babesia duncani TaxID=323732 RepID=A0AAD9UMX4_9APIC|nr:bifunctional RNA polymerase [Babesia duncani]